MSRFEMYGLTSLEVDRQDDELGTITLTLKGEDGTTVTVDAGRFYDDAASLRGLLDVAAFDARAMVDDWEDRPEPDEDGFIGFHRGAYWVTFGGKHIGEYPTRDAAEHGLAKAMTDSGYFPNTWYEDDHGGHVDIGDSVRAHHDAGGTGLRTDCDHLCAVGACTDEAIDPDSGEPYCDDHKEGWYR